MTKRPDFTLVYSLVYVWQGGGFFLALLPSLLAFYTRVKIGLIDPIELWHLEKARSWSSFGEQIAKITFKILTILGQNADHSLGATLFIENYENF